MKQPIRISMKELAKKHQVKLLIPDDYSALRHGVIEHQTDKAMKIDFIKNGKQWNAWFPKQFIIEAEGKIYAADWLIAKNTKDEHS